jgi:lysophospholipid acyltransferase
MYRWEVLHFWALGAVVYVQMSVLDRRIQKWVVFATCMGHISALHIYRLVYYYGSANMDVATFLMPLVLRLSSLGFIYSDGAKPESKLTEEQKKRKRDEKPTLLEILSYTSYPGSNMCGPFFEFSDYILFIEQKERYANIPSSVLFSTKKLCTGLMVLVL